MGTDEGKFTLVENEPTSHTSLVLHLGSYLLKVCKVSLSYSTELKCFLWNGEEVNLTESQRGKFESSRWTQSIPISSKYTTRGRIRSLETISKYYLDKIDFHDKSVLVVGGYEGFELLWARANGAREVVAFADDFNDISFVESNRSLLAELFPGEMTWIPGKIQDVAPSLGRRFDIVLFFDGVCHTHDPLTLLVTVADLCAETLVMCTPFIIDGAEIPLVTFFPNVSPVDSLRDVSSPNKLWLFFALSQAGFSADEAKIWEHDFASIVARRSRENYRGTLESRPRLSDLPTDEGLESDLAVVMITCQRYSSAWIPFFTLFQRYWPDCPYKVYMGTDKGSFPDVMTLQTGDDGGAKNWAQRLRCVLQAIPEKFVFLFQEDFLIQEPVHTVAIRKLARHMRDHDVGVIRAICDPVPRTAWHGCADLGAYGTHDDFRLSLQASIWDKEVLITLLKDGEDPWLTEFVGSRRSQFCQKPFLGVMFAPLSYYCTAIMYGEWDDGALELLRREGIPTEGIPKKL